MLCVWLVIIGFFGVSVFRNLKDRLVLGLFFLLGRGRCKVRSLWNRWCLVCFRWVYVVWLFGLLSVGIIVVVW